jgi:hypothetical protein
MTGFAALPTLQKNSLSTTTTTDMTTGSTEVEVTEQAVFYRDGVLLTHGWELGPDNAVEFLTEEVTVSATDSTSGPGTVTFSTRAVKADGSNGPAYAWPADTRIRNAFSTSVMDQIKDNFDNIPQSHNAIINGDCRVNQRGTAYTLVKDAYCWDSDNLYGPDRHEGMATGTAVGAGTFGQSTASLAGSSGFGFRFAGVTLTGTGIIYQRGRIEAKDAAEFKNKIASFSCKVYQDAGGAVNFTVYIRKANSADNFAAVTAIGNSGAVSIPNTTDTSLKYENISMGDCSTGIEYEIKGEVGAITNKNIYISEIQFESGPVATAFEIRNIQTERALCQRYYQKSYNLSIAPGTASQTAGLKCLVAQNTSAIPTPFLFPVPMRSSPTLLTYAYDGTSGAINLYGGANVTGVTAVTGENGPLEIDKSISLTAGAYYQFHYTAAAEL